MTDVSVAASFETLIGSSFQVVGEWPHPDAVDPADADSPAVGSPPALSLTITGVDVLDAAGPYEQFQVTFIGPRTTPLSQGTYVLDPPAGGFDALLLVPTADRGDEREYTASLSVSRPPTESAGT